MRKIKRLPTNKPKPKSKNKLAINSTIFLPPPSDCAPVAWLGHAW